MENQTIQDAIEHFRGMPDVCGIMFIPTETRRVYHAGVDAPWKTPLAMVEASLYHAEGIGAELLAQWHGRATIRVCGVFSRGADGSEPVGGKPFPWIGGAIEVE